MTDACESENCHIMMTWYSLDYSSFQENQAHYHASQSHISGRIRSLGLWVQHQLEKWMMKCFAAEYLLTVRAFWVQKFWALLCCAFFFLLHLSNRAASSGASKCLWCFRPPLSQMQISTLAWARRLHSLTACQTSSCNVFSLRQGKKFRASFDLSD